MENAPRRQRISVAVLVAALGLAPVASASTLLLEDFQSYLPGSNLIGQGGWGGGSTGGSPALFVGNGTYLSSIVLDGRNATGLNNIHFAGHPLSGALDPSAVTILSFDAWGTSTSPPSTNSGVGFGVGAPTNPAVVVPMYWNVQYPYPGWGFDARGLTGNQSDFIVIANSYDRLVRLSIVVDGPLGEVYGLYDFGSGASATPHFPISQGTISSLDYVSLFIDLQGGIYGGSPCGYSSACRLGPEIDNIAVATAVPEPATLLLFGFGLLGVAARRRFKPRT